MHWLCLSCAVGYFVFGLISCPGTPLCTGWGTLLRTGHLIRCVHVLCLPLQEMVEESRKRKAAQQQCGLEHPAAVLSGVPASRQDAFAAFATQYK